MYSRFISKLIHSSIDCNPSYRSVIKAYLFTGGQFLPANLFSPKTSIHKYSFLNKKHLFKTMACCGSNGCGTEFSKESLKKRLTSIQYHVTQECDTERAFSGKYCNHFEAGVYTCVVCHQDLFSSESKYESKCGWPAFYDVLSSQNVKLKNDLSHVSCNLLLLTMQPDMKRTEVSCSKCGAHLGHVFDDGPKPTGKRYCINSAALDFKKTEENEKPSDS